MSALRVMRGSALSSRRFWSKSSARLRVEGENSRQVTGMRLRGVELLSK
jgi:hypothetical protein